jgi:hypothetical protein
VSFYLAVAGVFCSWIGGANIVGRRLAARRWGALGNERAIWVKRGMIYAPDWLSVPIFFTGLACLATAGILWAVG